MPLFAAISDVVNCFDLEAIRFASLTTSSMKAAVSLQSPARVREVHQLPPHTLLDPSRRDLASIPFSIAYRQDDMVEG